MPWCHSVAAQRCTATRPERFCVTRSLGRGGSVCSTAATTPHRWLACLLNLTVLESDHSLLHSRDSLFAVLSLDILLRFTGGLLASGAFGAFLDLGLIDIVVVVVVVVFYGFDTFGTGALLGRRRIVGTAAADVPLDLDLVPALLGDTGVLVAAFGGDGVEVGLRISGSADWIDGP